MTHVAALGSEEVRQMLSYSGAVEAADWIVHSAIDPGRLITYGPAGFDAYARLRFLRDPAYVGEPEGGTEPLDIPPRMQLETLVRAVDALIPFTGSPDRGFFCVWDSGVPMASPMPREHARVEVPLRDSFLIEGRLSELAAWYDDLGLYPYDHPSFIWPTDHAWCIAADVDPHWAGVGASATAMERLLSVPGLDCVASDPNAPVARYD
jgi:hypothetical protein